MFQDKYKEDNEFIKPDEQLIASLTEKMKEYLLSETNTGSDPNLKSRTSYKKTAKYIAAAAACLFLFTGSFTILHMMNGSEKSSAIIAEDTTFDTSASQEAKSTVRSSGNSLDSGAMSDSDAEYGLESAPLNGNAKSEEKKSALLTASPFLLESQHIEKITLTLSSETTPEVYIQNTTETIEKITAFFNSLGSSDKTDVPDLNQKEESVLIEVYYMDGTSKIFTVFSDKYLKLEDNSWYLFNAAKEKEFAELLLLFHN